MNLLETKRLYIQALPVFLLVLSGGMEMGWLMAFSFFVHIIICRLYRIPVLGIMWKGKLYRKSWLFIFIFIGTIVFSWFFNQGSMAEIGHYVERIAPFLLLGIIARDDSDVPKVFWVGITISLAFVCIDTFLHPHYVGGRWMGSFGWPMGLASVLIVLLPVVIFGIVKYWQSLRVFSILAGITALVGVNIMILTGARSAFITMLIVMCVLLGILLKVYGVKILKLVLPIILVAGIAVSCTSSNVLENRFQNKIEDDGRVYLIEVSKQIFDKSPVFGIGTKKWGVVYHEQYELPGKEKGMQSPHNIFLQSVNENGIIGLAGFLSLLFFQFWTLLKNGISHMQNNVLQLKWSAGLLLGFLAILIYGQFDYAFYGRYVMGLFWLYWGLAVYVIQKEDK